MSKAKKPPQIGVPLVRTSERGDFKRCPFLWDMSWNKGLTSKREPTWAWFGTAIHKGLETYYIPGKKRNKVSRMLEAFEESLEGEVRKIYTVGGEVNQDEFYGNEELKIVGGKELGIAMLRGYVEEYGKDQEWEVIHPEQSFQIDVVDPNDESKVLAVYAGTWDLLCWNRRTKKFWLWDHKTRKTFLTDWSYLDLNDQAGSYLWVAPEVLRHLGIFGKKDQIEGIIFNYLRKRMPDERPLGPDGLAHNNPLKQHYIDALNAKDIGFPPKATVAVLAEHAERNGIKVWGDVSARQPAPLYHREEVYRAQAERATQGRRVQAEVAHMNAMRTGALPIYKTPGEDCVRCKIFDYCLLHESDPISAAALAKETMRPRDPYADHRETFEIGGVSINA